MYDGIVRRNTLYMTCKAYICYWSLIQDGKCQVTLFNIGLRRGNVLTSSDRKLITLILRWSSTSSLNPLKYNHLKGIISKVCLVWPSYYISCFDMKSKMATTIVYSLTQDHMRKWKKYILRNFKTEWTKTVHKM